jgi:hypothetical protein
MGRQPEPLLPADVTRNLSSTRGGNIRLLPGSLIGTTVKPVLPGAGAARQGGLWAPCGQLHTRIGGALDSTAELAQAHAAATATAIIHSRARSRSPSPERPSSRYERPCNGGCLSCCLCISVGNAPGHAMLHLRPRRGAASRLFSCLTVQAAGSLFLLSIGSWRHCLELLAACDAMQAAGAARHGAATTSACLGSTCAPAARQAWACGTGGLLR